MSDSSVTAPVEWLVAGEKEKWNAWRAEQRAGRADLRGARLAGVNLRMNSPGRVDLRDCLLDDADFSHAGLNGIDLSASSLRNACLADCDLRSALLQGADLSGADLGGARLSHAVYDGWLFAPARMDCPVCRQAVDLADRLSDEFDLVWHCEQCGWLAASQKAMEEFLCGGRNICFSYTSDETRHLDPVLVSREHASGDRPALISLCPLCAATALDCSSGQKAHWHCRACGTFELQPDDAAWLQGLSDEDRVRLGWATRKRSDAAQDATLSRDTMASLLDSVPAPANPYEAMEQLLIWVHRHGSADGRLASVFSWEAPVVLASGPEELQYVIDKSLEVGWLESGSEEMNASTQAWAASPAHLRPSLAGWRHINEVLRSRSDSRRVFVAMSFDPQFEECWELGIKPAVMAVGLVPVRLDKIEHNEKICDRIVAEIRSCGAIVADCSGGSGNVYFEAGFGMGLERPVIWACRESDKDQLRFDTRQYPHILWTTPQDLRDQLRNRLEATVLPALAAQSPARTA